MELVILTTTYNCESYVEKSLSTIMTQKHKDFRCFITDDMSTDGTVEKIKNFIKNLLYLCRNNLENEIRD